MPKTSRRTFLQVATVTGAGYMVAAGNQKVFSQSPNERPGVASVGVSGKGSSDCEHAAHFGKVIAICDVDKGHLNGRGKHDAFKDAKQYLDYREMFEKHAKEIDIVTVSPPDHMHAPVSLMAMRNGISCYTQKPLTRSIYEARKMAIVAKETGVCTQMGNQGSALKKGRWAIQQLRSGVIGPLKEIYAWTNRPVWPQEPWRANTLEKFAAEAKAQVAEGEIDEADAEKLIENKKNEIADNLKNLDWKLWLGVSPDRPFFPGIYHTFSWRSWWDFGSGALGDMACHMLTVPFDGCRLGNPTSVKAKTTGHDFDSFPFSSIIEYDFPNTDNHPKFKMWWYDREGNKPPMSVFEPWGIKPGIAGVLVIGEKGAFYIDDDYCNNPRFINCDPVADDQIKVDYAVNDWNNDDIANMYELFRAVDAKDPSICHSNFVVRGGPLTELVQLGNLAVCAAYKGEKDAAGKRGAMMKEWGPQVEWNAESMTVTNLDAIRKAEGDDVAEKIVSTIKPTYRDGYQLD